MPTQTRKRPATELNLLTANCPSRRALALITNKWVVLVMHALGERPERFASLQRRIEGISRKMLTQTVRRMEGNGLVLRRVFPTKPPSVEYSLTPFGEGLLVPIQAICSWAEAHGWHEAGPRAVGERSPSALGSVDPRR